MSLKLTAYYTRHSCANCQAIGPRPSILPGLGIQLAASPKDEIDRLAKLIRVGKLKNGNLDRTLLRRTASDLMRAVLTGYLRKPGAEEFTSADEQMISFMRENVFVFSGFKNHAMLQQASALLLDEAGQVKSLRDFKKDLQQLDHTYNMVYAEPEYEHAVASSQMASKWVSFKNLPPEFQNWKYRTAGDEHVRELHAILNNKVFRIGNPNTDNLFPPKGWRCRCDADATDEAVTKDFTAPQFEGMFNNNVGKNGVIFPSSHPYYQTSDQVAKRITAFSKAQIGE